MYLWFEEFYERTEEQCRSRKQRSNESFMNRARMTNTGGELLSAVKESESFAIRANKYEYTLCANTQKSSIVQSDLVDVFLVCCLIIVTCAHTSVTIFPVDREIVRPSAERIRWFPSTNRLNSRKFSTFPFFFVAGTKNSSRTLRPLRFPNLMR